MSQIGTARYGTDGYGNQPDHPTRSEPNHILWFFQIDHDGDGAFDSRTLPPTIRKIEFTRGVSRRDDPTAFGPSQPESERFLVELVDKGGGYWFGAECRALQNMGGGRFARLLCVSTTHKTPALVVFTGVLRQMEFDPAGVITFRGDGMVSAFTTGKAAEVRDAAIPYNTPDLGAFIPDSGAPAPIHHWRGQSPGTGADACVDFILDACASTITRAIPNLPTEEQPEYFTLTGGSAWNALRSVCSAYFARIEFDRTGTLRLRRCGEDDSNEQSALPFPEVLTQPTRATLPAPGLVNRVRCRLRPLHAPLYSLPIPDSEYGIAWSATGPIAVPPNSSLTLEPRFRKTEGSVFAANFLRVNSDLPIETVPLVVNSQPDKNGVNMAAATGSGEGSLVITPEVISDPNVPYPLFQNYGGRQDQCRITFNNTSQSYTAYFFNIRLYAAGLSQTVQPSWVEFADTESETLFGERLAVTTSPLIQNETFARQTAQRALQYFRSPTRAPIIKTSAITNGDLTYANFSSLDIGRLVDLPAGAYPAGKHRVLGESAVWLNGAGEYVKQEWILEKALAPQAAISSVNTAVIQNQNSAAWTHSSGAAAGEYFLVCASTRSWGWINEVSVDGTPLALLAESSLGIPTNGDRPRVEVWGGWLPAGTGAISVSLDKPDWAEFTSLSVANVDAAEPIRAVITLAAFENEAIAEMACGESDLMLCAAGFQQITAPSLSAGEQVTALTSDNNWRGAVASATGLRQASAAWSGITGGYALVGLVLNARWHHDEV